MSTGGVDLDLPLLSEGVGWGIVVGFGIAFCGLTVLLWWVEKRVFGVATTSEQFNTAGRTVGTGLTASVLVSQWTWAATLLQSSNVAWKYGVSGPFWYASGATIQIILFGILAVEVKRKCPNAHTFLEIINVRWGPTAHKVFMFFGFLAHCIVTGMLILGGSAVVSSLTGMNATVCCFFIPFSVIVYTMAGGLKATFMASYVHTLIIYIFMLTFMFVIYTQAGDNTLGSADAVFDKLQEASTNPFYLGQGFIQDNKDHSYLTMASEGGLIFGVINVVGNFGTVFVDQSYWQSAIAAKPSSALPGFILGGLCWFAIPFCQATTLGLANVALEVNMTADEAGQGLVPPFTAVALMGKGGAWMILIQLFMAVTSTGSAELIAMSSILTYDVYKQYFKPEATGEELLKFSRYVVVFIGLSMGILGVILDVAGLSLGWVYLAMGVLIGSAVFPISSVLLVPWVTKNGAMGGAILGLFFAILTWFLAALNEDCAEISIDCLGGDFPMLYGNLVAILGSMVITLAISYFEGGRDKPYDFEGTKAVKLIDGEEPRYDEKDLDPEVLDKTFSKALKWGGAIAIVLVIVWPLPMHASQYVFSRGFFKFWIAICFIWAIVAGMSTTFLPLWDLFKIYQGKGSTSTANETEMAKQDQDL